MVEERKEEGIETTRPPVLVLNVYRGDDGNDVAETQREEKKAARRGTTREEKRRYGDGVRSEG